MADMRTGGKLVADGLKDEGVRMHFLATWWDVLKVAKEGQYFSDDKIAEVRKFLEDPIGWSGAHGGRSEY